MKIKLIFVLFKMFLLGVQTSQSVDSLKMWMKQKSNDITRLTALHRVKSKLSIRETHSDCEQILNAFSAVAEAVIALEGQQAGCNDIINLLTTTQRLGWFPWRLCHPSVCSQVGL